MICRDVARGPETGLLDQYTVCLKCDAYSAVYCPVITNAGFGTATTKITGPPPQITLHYPKLEIDDLFCSCSNSEMKIIVVSISVFVSLSQRSKCTRGVQNLP